MGHPELNSVKQNADITTSDLLNLYWNYYEFHAGQRMRILELYIGFMTGLFGAYFAVQNINPRLATAAACAISAFSFIFYQLDVRTTNLLHACRLSIRKLEETCSGYYDDTLKMFTQVKNNESGFTFSCMLRFCYDATFIAGILLIDVVSESGLLRILFVSVCTLAVQLWHKKGK